MKREIAFKDTIDQIVALKMGIPVEIVEANTDFLIKHIQDLMLSAENIRLVFPHLGSAFLNKPKLRKALENAEKSFFPVKEERKDFYRSAIEKIDSLPMNRQTRRHTRRVRMSDIYFTDTKSLEEQEEEQNNSCKNDE